MMTMMMMQRLLQQNNNNNNGYADETRLNGIRHHSASPFSKPAATALTTAAHGENGVGDPESQLAANEPTSPPPPPPPPSATVVTAVATCTTAAAATMTAVPETADDDRLTSDDDEDDELNVDEDPVDLTNNRLHLGPDNAQAATGTSTAIAMDTTNDYETASGGGSGCGGGGAGGGGAASTKGRLAFSVENILDPNKFTKKLIAPAAVLPRWRPRVDFASVVDPSAVAGK